ncbi:MAG: ATP-binding cassette domain-containing protein [Pseudomonadota bacterium]
MSPEPAIALQGVCKSYGDTRVLENLDLSLAAGGTSAMVGASGSGKTTLLQLINGLVRPDRGRVQVFGDDVPDAGIESFRHRIGYSVQGAGLFPHLTVHDNVTLVARLKQQDPSEIAERLARLFEAMELSSSLHARYPHELSGGQQQRVGLCRALMLEPELLLLDEPFSAIDPITRAEVYRLFERTVQDQPVTTVLVTHDMREAVRLADDLVILKDGRVLQHGPPATIIAEPADEYVRTLVKDQLA